MSAHILIFEPDANGDQMDYVRHLLVGIETYVVAPQVTLLTTGHAADHVNCRRLIADYPHLVTLRIAPPVTESNRFFRLLNPFYERQWKNAEMVTRAIAAMAPQTVDFVYFPYLETIGLLHLALRRNLFHGRPWATIAHNVRFHHRACGIKGPTQTLDILQGFFFRRVIGDPSLACFGTNNPYLPTAADHPKIVFCPPPAIAPKLSDPAAARAFYGIRSETCVVLVFGFIDKRKCVDILLAGMAHLPPDVDVTVLLAGAQHPAHLAPVMASETARTVRDCGRLIEVNRFIDYENDIDPMSAADIVWVFYEKDFVRNSDVLARSAMAWKPVIARDQGLIGRIVEDHRLGLALADDTPGAIAAALTQLANDPDLRRTMGDNGRRAFEQNTPERLVRPIVDAINRVTG